MNAPTERTESLNPDPREIAAFIQSVAESPWPSADDQFSSYFEDLGCELERATHNDDDAALGVTRGSFVTRRFTTKNSSWVALDGSLFSLNLFAYEDAVDLVTTVDAGFDRVRNHLVSMYGQPFDEQLSPQANRSAAWLVRETVIELYAHVSLAPALQIGLGHKAHNAVYEHRLLQIPDKQKP